MFALTRSGDLSSRRPSGLELRGLEGRIEAAPDLVDGLADQMEGDRPDLLRDVLEDEGALGVEQAQDPVHAGERHVAGELRRLRLRARRPGQAEEDQGEEGPAGLGRADVAPDAELLDGLGGIEEAEDVTSR